jgi:hypothetical protein
MLDLPDNKVTVTVVIKENNVGGTPDRSISTIKNTSGVISGSMPNQVITENVIEDTVSFIKAEHYQV